MSENQTVQSQISQTIDAKSVETEIQISTEILIMLFLLMLSITLGHYLKKSKHKYLQEAGLTTIVGMLTGLTLKYMSVGFYSKKISTHFNNLFMILLLPPIIFESGYNMQKGPFFKNIGTVLMYSFLGTFIAIVSTSVIFFCSTNFTPLSFSPRFSLKESFAYGSLISATDPVSVLAIFKEMNADANLYAIVFGESIFNDAISIVMYETVKNLGTEEDVTLQAQVFEAVCQFTLIFVGSILIGAFSALTVAFLKKRLIGDIQVNKEIINMNNQQDSDKNILSQQNEEMKDKDSMSQRQINYFEQQNMNSEVSMMIMCPWVSYLIADGLGLSGIVAILTNGIFLNIYAAQNISEGSRKVLKISYETIAYSAETLVFLFLGIGVFAFDHPKDKFSVGAIIVSIINFNFARFLNIGVTTFIVNKTRTESKINLKQQFVMWISGLRGAMAYALGIQSIFDFGENGKSMLYLTLIYSIITILGVASILNPILEFCEVINVQNQKPDSDHRQDQDQSEKKLKCCELLKKMIYNFNNNYFAPVFIGKAGQIEQQEEEINDNQDKQKFERMDSEIDDQKSCKNRNCKIQHEESHMNTTDKTEHIEQFSR